MRVHFSGVNVRVIENKEEESLFSMGRALYFFHISMLNINLNNF